LTPHLLYIGGEDHYLRIPAMLALRDNGFRLTAASSGGPAPFVQAGFDFRPFHFDRFINPLGDWRALKALSRLLAELRPDLVQSFDNKPNLMLPLAARSVSNVQVVRTINGRAWLYSSSSPLVLTLRPIYRALHRFAVRSTAATTFEIRDDQAFFERHRLLGDKRSELIPGAGIDVKGFERALAMGPSPTQLRHELGLGTAEIVITVTRMTRQKGLPALLKAAALVHEARPGVRFLLVGPRQSEGPLAVSQAEIDRHAPYVKALGPRSDVPALLSLADVFAFPTEYREGVPRVLLEAALADLPIVTTSMPGCCTVIRDGWNGFVVPPRTPRLLAARIIDLLNDRESGRAMASRTAEQVRQEFGLETIIARYTALYAEVLRGSARGQLQTTDASLSETAAIQGSS
jgi:glycosyltransferase involved in cell wall biosynthesis